MENSIISRLRVGSTIQKSDTKEEIRVNLDVLGVINLYEGKSTGCPYEYKPVTTDWLLSKGFVKLPKEDSIYGYKRHFFIAETNRGYEYIPNVVEFRSYGTPKKYCHEIENLYHDLFE